MDSCHKKYNLCDSKEALVGLEETWEDVKVPASRGSASNSSVRWSIVAVLMGFVLIIFVGFVLMFLVVARQQAQISTMQLKLDEIFQDEIDPLEYNYDLSQGEELNNNETETEEGKTSRQRRQAGSQSQNYTPFAHLVQIQNRPRAHAPYKWSRPPQSRHSASTASYYSNVRLHPSSGDGDVEAIQISISGWYYVYAQVPYDHNSDIEHGHKIVKRGNCGGGYAVTVLQTLVQLPCGPDNICDDSKQNWKYLGGVVYLASGDHIQVRPVTDMQIGTRWLNEGDNDSRVGGFFGLYQVQPDYHGTFRSC